MTTEAKSELDQLTEQAERARAALARAQAKADQERQAAEQRRVQAHEQFDRQTMAKFDEESLDAEVDRARAALREAVLADPVWQAVVRLNVAQRARVDAKAAYNTAAARVQADPLPYFVGSYWPVTPEDLSKIAERESAEQAADLADAHDQARVDAGEEAARRRP